MDSASYVTISHMTALRRRMDITANNVANMNTTGYRADKPLFTDYLINQPKFGDKVAYVQDFGIVRDMRTGPAQQTGNPLDLMLDGEGYFAVEAPQGTRYTRAGSFLLSQDSQIVTQSGYPVLDVGGNPIQLPDDINDITITAQGDVVVDDIPIAQLQVAQFADERELTREAGSLYRTEQDPIAAEEARILQGILEGSNVVAVQEMTNLIDVSRKYMSAKRFLDDEQERRSQALRTLAGVR